MLFWIVDARRRGHAGRLGHLHQVPREEGLAPELQDVKIHCGGQTAQQGRQAQGGQRGEAGEPVHRHPDEEEQPPRQQVGFWVGKDVLHKGISAQGAAGDVLGEHQKQKGGRRRKQQPRPKSRRAALGWCVIEKFLSLLRFSYYLKLI